MKVKDKIKNFFYLEEEEEYVEEQTVRKEPIRQQAVPQQQARQQQVQPPIVNRPAAVKKQSMKERQKQVDYPSNVPNLVSITQKTSKLVLSEPRVYSEAQDIADNLKNKRAVVVNLQRIERDQGMRIIDFISGTIFALGGDIKKIGKDIFLCTPDNMEVDGNISEYLYDDQ